MTIKPYLFRTLAALGAAAGLLSGLMAQPDRWQQAIDYRMEVEMDVETNRYTGTQQVTYTNHSPDTLRRVFYHLYFNAFQPHSMMDVRSRSIADPDRRVRDRIYRLDEDEIGYLHVQSLEQDGQDLAYEEVGTILEVELAEPILPGRSVEFDLAFAGQVPLQVRRSGRDNAEGVRYSMSQWYPKMCEYDYEGWHANPYIGREFHGVWGDFEVKITIDSAYVVGGTGYLQNPQAIGHGYAEPGSEVQRPAGDQLTWHFKAPQVHDFMWAADPDYRHTTAEVPGGPTLHFFYQDDADIQSNWEALPGYTAKAFQFMNEHFGPYPHEQFSVVQGGDGGMEYPMSTLITGERQFRSLVGVTVHELIHSWYQGVLATNESLYPWMDEGFTSYASAATMNHLFPSGQSDIFSGSYRGYYRLVESDLEEPMTTHSDHYATNFAYGRAAYSKGAVTLAQLGYVIGEETLMRGMRRYFDTWKFKHPNPTDFKRIMEKESGLELDWYFEHWINTTNTIDYGLGQLRPYEGGTLLTLHRHGAMMMPLEVVVTSQAGTEQLYYIPLRMMRGQKAPEGDRPRTVLADWPWTYEAYSTVLPIDFAEIQRIEIDPSQRMADVERDNNLREMTAPEVIFEKK